MDGLNWVVAFGSFMLGVAGTGLTAYVVSRNKLSGKIDEISEKIGKITLQETAIAQAKETGKLQAISEKIDSIVYEQKLISSANEAAKIDVLTSKMEEVLEQQKCITLTTETIKSDIENSSWRKKENQILRRQKIELLYIKTVEYSRVRVNYLYPQKNIQQKELFESHNYFYSLYAEILMIIELYFNINNELLDVSSKVCQNHGKDRKSVV